MADREIGKISKGEYQGTATDIIVAVREYNGKVGVDIREYTTSDKYTGPTKKGLRIPADRFAEFKEMINSIPHSDLTASGSSESGSSHKSPENGSIDRKPHKPGKSFDEELPDY
jgi:Transcriptional Coactivator p15 (PC4)